MSLVDYSCSDEEESPSDDDDKYKRHNDGECSNSRPSNISKTEDDDNINTGSAGRVRTFAHERGNWATFIYIPFPLNDSIRKFQGQIVKSFENNIHLHFIESLHISLTRTVVLQHHWIDQFTTTVKESLVGFKKFRLDLNMLSVYCNDERTTTFVAISVPDIYCTPLKTLVDRFNSCMCEYKLPIFYENASFHVSILWCLGNKKSEILKEIEKLQRFLIEAIDDDYEDFQIVVNEIKCKVGNKIYNYPLLS